MNKKVSFRIFMLAVATSLAVFTSCSSRSSKDGSDEEKAKHGDILNGRLSVIVDETLLPIIEEQVDVFQNSYKDSKIELVSAPEVKGINLLLQDRAKTAIMTRKLTASEEEYFKKKSISPKVFQIATDAVVFISNTGRADTSITVENVVKILKGENIGQNYSLILDNVNSSTLRQLKDIGKIEKISGKGLKAMENGEEVLSYVAEHTDGIGIISYDQWLNAKRSFQNKDKIRTLSVQNSLTKEGDNKFYLPNQSTLAEGLYVLSRPVYILNYQPDMGLGVGFSAFLTGDRGQRIMLKADLVPATMPGREIIIRDKVE